MTERIQRYIQLLEKKELVLKLSNASDGKEQLLIRRSKGDNCTLLRIDKHEQYWQTFKPNIILSLEGDHQKLMEIWEKYKNWWVEGNEALRFIIHMTMEYPIDPGGENYW